MATKTIKYPADVTLGNSEYKRTVDSYNIRVTQARHERITNTEALYTIAAWVNGVLVLDDTVSEFDILHNRAFSKACLSVVNLVKGLDCPAVRLYKLITENSK